MWTPAQLRAFQKGQAVANEVLPRLERLEALATISPRLAEQVQSLRTQRDYLARFCEAALELHRQTDD
jgi:hypothetical protein